jgi:hypothetical protein
MTRFSHAEIDDPDFGRGAIGTTHLYRLFSMDGALLYVGISTNVRERLRYHRQKKIWWADVFEIGLQEVAENHVALALEREVIGGERPLHNIRSA